MNNDPAIDLLNDLLQQEARSLLPRMRESTVFVSWASADEQRVLTKMIEEENEHRRWLVEAINRLGGAPLPVGADITSTRIHYLELDYVFPRVVENQWALLKAYESAAADASASPIVSDVITRLIDRRRKHCDQLARLASRAKSSPA